MYQQQSLGLAGPNRSTIEAAQADRAHILGVLKDIPVKEAKQREEDLTAAKDRASNLMQQVRLKRGIEWLRIVASISTHGV